jgi:hypothetical protein
LKSLAKDYAVKQPSLVVAVSELWVTQTVMPAIVSRDKRFQVCTLARGFDAGPNLAVSDNLPL